MNYSTFQTTSIISNELWRDTVPLDSNCFDLPQSVFYMVGNYTSYHADKNISHQRRCGRTKKKRSQNPSFYYTSQRYLQHHSTYAYRTKIRQSCPLSDSNSNAQEFLVEVPLSNFNCYDACYNTNMATDICFGTLHSSIWKTNWSLHNMWPSTVKRLERFII